MESSRAALDPDWSGWGFEKRAVARVRGVKVEMLRTRSGPKWIEDIAVRVRLRPPSRSHSYVTLVVAGFALKYWSPRDIPIPRISRQSLQSTPLCTSSK